MLHCRVFALWFLVFATLSLLIDGNDTECRCYRERNGRIRLTSCRHVTDCAVSRSYIPCRDDSAAVQNAMSSCERRCRSRACTCRCRNETVFNCGRHGSRLRLCIIRLSSSSGGGGGSTGVVIPSTVASTGEEAMSTTGQVDTTNGTLSTSSLHTESTTSSADEFTSCTHGSASSSTNPTSISLSVGLSITGLVLLAVVVAFAVLYRRRKLPGCVQRASVRSYLRSLRSIDSSRQPTTSPVQPTYENIIDPIRSAPSGNMGTGARRDYEQLHVKPTFVSTPPPPGGVYSCLRPSTCPTPGFAANVISSAGAAGNSSLYSGTATTLIDNALYDQQQASVTSSNVAEADDDVTDLTIIDNDLYELESQSQGQRNTFVDCECTLVENDLYG